MNKRDKVWLGVSVIVKNSHGEYLVLKKQYGGLKDKWSFPAGFVENGEGIDDAAIRELKEETGIDGIVTGIAGVRSGVIKDVISDNMIIMYVRPLTEVIKALPDEEIAEAKWLSPKEILSMPRSPMLDEFILHSENHLFLKSTDSPGPEFKYTKYHLYY